MINKLLKKGISLAMAFAAILSLSCCGVGNEVLIDEIDTEPTTEEMTETTTSDTAQEEITEEPTTNKTTEELATEETTEETTTEEVTEPTTEAITISIPDETAEAILASLSDEEKEVWLSMPDIVTIRLLRRYDGDEGDLYSEFLYTEVIYIDKTGQVKKFISPDKLAPSETECTVEWIHDQISRNEDAELINTADIHTLIEFYNTLTCIDPNSKLEHWGSIGLAVYIERHYWFEIFGIRSDGGKNSYEVLEISAGDAGYYSIQHNYIDKYDSHGVLERKDIDKYGRDTFDLYLKLDPFMVKRAGGTGYLTGEDG